MVTEPEHNSSQGGFGAISVCLSFTTKLNRKQYLVADNRDFWGGGHVVCLSYFSGRSASVTATRYRMNLTGPLFFNK